MKKNTTLYLFILNFIFLNQYGHALTTPSRNFFLDNWSAKTFSVPITRTAMTLSTAVTPSATVEISIQDTLAATLPTHFGVNTTFRNGSTQNSRAALYKGIATTMRFPAGSGSDTYFFDGVSPSSTETIVDNSGATTAMVPINGQLAPNMTPENFISFKKNTNGEAIVVVNYMYARYGITTTGTRAARVQQAADYAAAFVKRMNVTLGGNVKYWEIGNETYGKWEVGYQVTNPLTGTITGQEYGEDCNVFIQAMKAVDPTIKCGVVITIDDDVWNAGVMPQVQDCADFFIIHNYFTPANAATSANLLAAVPSIAQSKTFIDNCVTSYTTKPAGYFPIAMTEFNARGSYNCSMFNGLFVSQILGEGIKNGYGLVSLWVSEWAWDDTNTTSMGFLALADPEQSDYTARPSYIPFYYYNKVFGDHMVNSTSTNSSIKSYASLFKGGEVGVVLVNSSNATQTVSLNLKDKVKYLSFSQILWYDFYANTIEPTVAGYKKFYINGVTSLEPGGGPSNLDNVAPYLSDYVGNSVITMRPNSVIYMTVIRNATDIATIHTDGFETKNGYASNFSVAKQNAWSVSNPPLNSNPNTFTGLWLSDIYSSSTVASDKSYSVSAFPEERTGGTGTQCLKFNITDTGFGTLSDKVVRLRGISNVLSFNTALGETAAKYEVSLWARVDGASRPVFKSNTATPITVTSTWTHYILDRYVIGLSSTALAIDFLPQADNSNYAVYIDDIVVKYKTNGSTATEKGPQLQNFSFYPNPAHDMVEFSCPEKVNSIQIIDLKGKKVKEMLVESASCFSVRDLPKGIYFINAISANSCYRSKIVVE